MHNAIALIGHGKHGHYLESRLKELGITNIECFNSSNKGDFVSKFDNFEFIFLACPPASNEYYMQLLLKSTKKQSIYLEKPFQINHNLYQKIINSTKIIQTGLWMRASPIFYALQQNSSNIKYISIVHTHNWQNRQPSSHAGIANRLLIHFADLIFSSFNSLAEMSSLSKNVSDNNCCLCFNLKNSQQTIVNIYLSYDSYPHSTITAIGSSLKLVMKNGGLRSYINEPLVLGEKAEDEEEVVLCEEESSFSKLMQSCTSDRILSMIDYSVPDNDFRLGMRSESHLKDIIN